MLKGEWQPRTWKFLILDPTWGGLASRKRCTMGYESAGMVEFIVDMLFRHFFVEMNTRLRVILNSYLIIFLKKTSTIMLLCNMAPCLIYSCGVFYVLWLFTKFKDLFLSRWKTISSLWKEHAWIGWEVWCSTCVRCDDGTKIAHGIQFTKIWHLRNCASSVWTTQIQLVHVGGMNRGLYMSQHQSWRKIVHFCIIFVATEGIGSKWWSRSINGSCVPWKTMSLWIVWIKWYFWFLINLLNLSNLRS